MSTIGHETEAINVRGLKATLQKLMNEKAKIDGGTITLGSNTITPLQTSGGSMENTNVVTNLNADLLDGLEATDFARKYSYSLDYGRTVKITFGNYYQAMVFGRSTNGTSCDLVLIGTGYTTGTNHWRALYKGNQVSWCTLSNARGIEVKNAHSEGTLYINIISLRGTPTFEEVADLEGTAVDAVMALTTSTVAAARKLSTARSLWGNDFNGEADISSSIVLNNANYLYCKDAVDADTTRNLIGLNGSNNVLIGYGLRSVTDSNTSIYAGTGGLRFNTNGTSTRAVIDSDGNMGVGTTEPTEKLTVSGGNILASRTNTTKTKVEATNSNGSIAIDVTTNRGLINPDQGTWMIATNKAGENTWLPQGNVGIGQNVGTAPSYKLHVAGAVGATAYNNTSDVRKKDIIEDLNLDIEDIASAPLFRFRWLDPEMGTDVNIGTSAQYWQTVLPEIVSEGADEDKTLSMQYSVAGLASTIALARKVVEQEGRIKALEDEIKELKNKFNN